MSTVKSEFAALRKTKRGIVFMVITSAALLALVLWALISFGVSVAQKHDLIHNGVKTTATVTAKNSDFIVLRGGGVNSYTVSYTFTDDVPGQPQKVTHDNVEVSQPAWQDASVGSPIDVVYKQGDVMDNQPIAAASSINPMASVVLYLFFGFGMVYVISYLVKKCMPTKKRWGFWWGIAIIVVAFFVGYWITTGVSALIRLLFL